MPPKSCHVCRSPDRTTRTAYYEPADLAEGRTRDELAAARLSARARDVAVHLAEAAALGEPVAAERWTCWNLPASQPWRRPRTDPEEFVVQIGGLQRRAVALGAVAGPNALYGVELARSTRLLLMYAARTEKWHRGGTWKAIGEPIGMDAGAVEAWMCSGDARTPVPPLL